MKLTIISPYPPNTGGLATYTKRNVDYLKTIKNLDVDIIQFNSLTDLFKVCGIYKNHPDFVRLEYNIPAYGLSTIPLFLIILVYRLLTPIKFVVNYHEVSRETATLGLPGKVFYFIFSYTFHHIYVHTEQAKNILAKKCWIHSNKITTIAHGTTTMEGEVLTPSQMRKKYELDERKIILTFGFIHPDKGIEYLLKALAILKKSDQTLYAKIQVVVAGDVRVRSGIFTHFQNIDLIYKTSLLQLTKELKIEDSVSFVNYVEPKWVNSLLNIAHIAVLPYIKTEQSGVLNLLLPIGIPIIASDIGGLGETLRATGILVKPRDTHEIAARLKQLMVDNDYYILLRRQYKKLIKPISPGKVMNLFIHSLNLVK